MESPDTQRGRHGGYRAQLIPRPLMLAEGHASELDLMQYDLFRSETYAHVAAALSDLPLIWAFGIRLGRLSQEAWPIVVA